MKNKAMIIMLLIAAAAAGCGRVTEDEALRLPFFNRPDLTPEWVAEADEAAADLHRVADFTFTDQNGENVTNATFAGKIYVADFFFTECTGICPKMATNMQRVQEAFRDDEAVMLLSHTVLPRADSVPRLRAYAIAHDVDAAKWRLVTGERDAIYNLARRAYFAEEDAGYIKGPEEFLHTENFVLVDGKGRIRGIYNGTLGAEMERLIADIALLKANG